MEIGERLPVAEPTNVAVVHASRLIREGTADLLGRRPDLRLIGRFEHAQDVLQQPPPDDAVLLYDLNTARQDGPPLVMELHQRLPRLKILMFNVME